MNIFKLIAAVAVGSFIGGAAIIGAISWIESRASEAVQDEAITNLLDNQKRIKANCDDMEKQVAQLKNARDQMTTAIIENHKSWLMEIAKPGADKSSLNRQFSNKSQSLETQKLQLEDQQRKTTISHTACIIELLKAEQAVFRFKSETQKP